MSANAVITPLKQGVNEMSADRGAAVTQTVSLLRCAFEARNALYWIDGLTDLWINESSLRVHP